MELTRQVLEANPNPIYVKDRKGKIVIANAAFAKMHHMSLATLLKQGRLPHDYSFERDLEVMEGNTPASFEESYRLGSEHKVWYHTVKNTIVLENGERYLLSISFDISTCKNALQAATNFPEAHEKYLADVRQELKSSAGAILSMGEQLRKQPLTKDQEMRLNAMLSIASKLPDIPADLLMENKSLSSKLPTETQPPKQPLYDFSGLGSLMNDPVFVRKMQLLFVETVPQQLTKLADAIYSEDWSSVGHMTHRLRSIFANIRVDKATAALRELEENAAGEQNFAANHRLLSTLYTVTNAIVTDFKEQLQANSCPAS